MNTPITALQRALEIAGGQNALARAIGVKQPSIWAWVNRSTKISAENALAIERATGISRCELRPDIFLVPLPQSQNDEVRNAG